MRFCEKYLGIVFVVSLLLGSCSKHQTIELKSLPQGTPEGAALFITGPFNNWNPADPQYQLNYDTATQTYSITLPQTEAEYKYTRGSFESIETDKCGNTKADRKITNAATQIDSIEGWLDITHKDCEQIVFIIEPANGKSRKTEKIYLATKATKWKAGNKKYLFEYQANGTYSLIVRNSINPLRFNIFRNKHQQFDTPQEISNTNDTMMFTLMADEEEPKPEPKAKGTRQHKKKEEALATKAIPKEKPQRTQTITLNAPAAPVFIAPVAGSPKKLVQQKPADIPTMKPKTVPPSVKMPVEDTRKRVFVIIDKLPVYGREDNMYVAGDFNEWNIAEPNYVFQKMPNGKRVLVFRLNDNKSHDFKITRGETGTDEANYREEEIDFHEIKSGSEDDTIHVRIDSWIDAYPHKRLVFYLVGIPDNTPEGDEIYLTGNFNNWDLQEERYKFEPIGRGRFVLTIDDFGKRYKAYKITRGSWPTEATTAKGKVPSKSGLPFDFIKRDTIKIQIDGWADTN